MMRYLTENADGRGTDLWRGCCAVRAFAATILPGVLALATPATLHADEPLVSIFGGVDQVNRQFYTWTVVNRHTSPIVFIEFSQYHGDMFTPPKGWSQEWKNKASLGGGEDAPGWVRTAAKDAARGIQPGGSAQFQLRVAHAGALSRPGRVTVRFADGSQVVLKDVEVPSSQTFLEQNIMMFGMGVIFVIAVLLHLRSRRKAAKAPQVPPETE